MNITDLQIRVEKAEQKIAKTETLINKVKSQLNKKTAALDKILEENNLSFHYDDVKDIVGWFYNYQNSSFYQELYWANCDISEKEDNIKSNENKLKEAQESLKRWQERLRLEEVKNQYIQDNIPQVIKDFLLDWKSRVTKWYLDKKDTFIEDRKEHRIELNKAYFEDILENPYLITKSWNRERFTGEYDSNESYSSMVYANRDKCKRARKLLDEFEAKYDNFFMSFYAHDLDEDWLEKPLSEEMNNKLIDLMTRVSKITGEILDASGLYLKEGNLNGYIVGKDGKAQVETIGAGGYNIVCFHFRTLVKPIRDK